jgi:hypothetical protein
MTIEKSGYTPKQSPKGSVHYRRFIDKNKITEILVHLMRKDSLMSEKKLKK